MHTQVITRWYLKMLAFLIDNIDMILENQVFQQSVGIHIGTNCAPLLSDVFFIHLNIVEWLIWIYLKFCKKLKFKYCIITRYRVGNAFYKQRSILAIVLLVLDALKLCFLLFILFLNTLNQLAVFARCHFLKEIVIQYYTFTFCVNKH